MSWVAIWHETGVEQSSDCERWFDARDEIRQKFASMMGRHVEDSEFSGLTWVEPLRCECQYHDMPKPCGKQPAQTYCPPGWPDCMDLCDEHKPESAVVPDLGPEPEAFADKMNSMTPKESLRRVNELMPHSENPGILMALDAATRKHDELLGTVAPEHRALSFGRLASPEAMNGGRR